MKWLIPILISSSTFAQTCDYDHKSKETYRYQIESVSVKNTDVRTYDNGASECFVSLDVVVDGRMHPTIGSYIYGPDISQTLACERATLNGKEKVLSFVSPVKINSEKNMDCSLSSEKKEEKVQSCRQWKTIFVDGVKTKGWKDICDV